MKLSTVLSMILCMFICSMTVAKSVQADIHDVQLSWDDNSDNETGFKIEHWTSANPNVQTYDAAANATSHTLQIDNSTTNYFRVYAYNYSGQSNFSNQAVFTIPGDITADEAADLKDVIVALQIVSDSSTFQDIHLEADLDGDARIGGTDASKILEKIAAP